MGASAQSPGLFFPLAYANERNVLPWRRIVVIKTLGAKTSVPCEGSAAAMNQPHTDTLRDPMIRRST
jgi:hypothetical protein